MSGHHYQEWHYQYPQSTGGFEVRSKHNSADKSELNN